MARNPITFQNGTLVANAKVEVGGTVYDVTPAQYEGSTPLSANNLNQLQTNLYDYTDEKNNELKGTIVYNNSSGVNNNINFTFPTGKSLSDYSRIKVFSKIVFQNYTLNVATEALAIQGNSISINSSRMHSEGLWINDVATYILNSNSLSKVYESDVRIAEGGTASFNKNTTRTLITKVILYEE